MPTPPRLRRSLARLATLLLPLGLGCGLSPSPRHPVIRDSFEAPASVLRVGWSRPLVKVIPILAYKPQEFASAAVSEDGKVFIGASTKIFYALRQRDGESLWTRELTGGVSSEPLYLPAGAAGPRPVVVVGDDDGALTALSADSGEVRWTYRVRGTIRIKPTYCDGVIYFTSGEGKLYAVDAKAGTWRWQYEREVPESFAIRGTSGALCASGRVYAGFPDGYIAALNAGTGEAVWTRQLSGDAARFTDVDSTPALHGDTIYATSYSGGVYALDVKDGSTRWRYELEGAGPLALDPTGEHIYVSAAKAGAHCFDDKGHLLWHQALSRQGELSTPTLWGPYLLLSAAGGGAYVAKAQTGELLQFFDPGQGVTGRPVAQGGRVYLLSNAGVFFSLSAG